MAFRANQAFISWASGFKQQFSPDQIVPPEVAAKAPGLVYDDGAPAAPSPVRRTKRSATPDDTDTE